MNYTTVITVSQTACISMQIKNVRRDSKISVTQNLSSEGSATVSNETAHGKCLCRSLEHIPDRNYL